ncbi:unnamed protein product [Lactuca virosa]|uniref:DUF659 domain-containing protein n=1 Tax=Lactuca virosa TaxID=75947 RepID=A0AAU9LRU3_9ASTR|nr:unnamed protein product [Lactuca virosa]
MSSSSSSNVRLCGCGHPVGLWTACTGISICKKPPATKKLNMKRYEEKKVESQAKEVKFPCEAGIGFKKRKGISTSIERAFGVEIRDPLDQEIARMFYTGGLPFNLARNPHYLRAFQFSANNKIVGDGWSDPTRKPLINFMATSGNGPLFLKVVNCFEEVKDRFYIVELTKEVVDEIGHQNVVQIITNNAANCKAVGEIIESQFPHIYWTPCVVHTLNLALKNICPPRNVETNELTYEQYYSDAWLLEDSTRCAPHRDGEISQERMKCLRRLFPNDDEYSKVLDEYAMFSIKSGPFEDLTRISKMAIMGPKNWWVNFGAQTPFLQTLALRLLGKSSSSSCVERNWSTYAFIHSLKRNKLTTSRAQDLVYIHNNLRLLSRNPNDDVKMWDVGGDAFDSMEDVGFLEVTDLSLDEPDFENDLIIDN